MASKLVKGGAGATGGGGGKAGASKTTAARAPAEGEKPTKKTKAAHPIPAPPAVVVPKEEPTGTAEPMELEAPEPLATPAVDPAPQVDPDPVTSAAADQQLAAAIPTDADMDELVEAPAGPQVDNYDFRKKLDPEAYDFIVTQFVNRDGKQVHTLKQIIKGNDKGWGVYFRNPPLPMAFPSLHGLGNYQNGKFPAGKYAEAKFSLTLTESVDQDAAFISAVRRATGNLRGDIDTVEVVKDQTDYFDAAERAEKDILDNVWKNGAVVAPKIVIPLIEGVRAQMLRARQRDQKENPEKHPTQPYTLADIPADDPLVLEEARILFTVPPVVEGQKGGFLPLVRRDKNGRRRITIRCPVFRKMDMKPRQGKAPPTHVSIPIPRTDLEKAWNEGLIYRPISFVDGSGTTSILRVEDYAPLTTTPPNPPAPGKLTPTKVLNFDIGCVVHQFRWQESAFGYGVSAQMVEKPIQVVARSSRPKGPAGYVPNKYAQPYKEPTPEELDAEEARRNSGPADTTGELGPE
jgi:hypothetical protein